MPWKVYQAGGKYCVHKINSDGSRGAVIPGGCHPSKSKAEAHMRALYVNVPEGRKELEKEVEITQDMTVPPENDIVEKDMHSDEATVMPYGMGATSFKELEQQSTERERAMEMGDLIYQYNELVTNINSFVPEAERLSNFDNLYKEFNERMTQILEAENPEDATKEVNDGFIKRVVGIVKSVFREPEKMIIDEAQPVDNGVMFLKSDDGSLWWVARYSNKFEDQDNPPDIISEKSHKRFEEMVDKGEAPLPELWFWHVPEWRIGVAKEVAYDDSGFSCAFGSIDKSAYDLVEWMMAQPIEWANSHGMPYSTVKRDPDDKQVIIEHETKEISVLPLDAAANKLTSFHLLMEEKMFSEDKKQSIKAKIGIPDEIIARLEQANQEDAEKAKAEGMKSKDVTELNAEATATETVETTVEETAETTSETPSEDTVDEVHEAVPAEPALSRQEIAEAVATVVNEALSEVEGRFLETVKALAGGVETLSTEIALLKQKDETRLLKTLSDTPNASLAAMIARNVSAIGSDEAKVRKDAALAKQKPEETEPEVSKGKTGVRFLDQFIQ